MTQDERRRYCELKEAVAACKYQLTIDKLNGYAKGELWRAKCEFALSKYECELIDLEAGLCRCSGACPI